jgi:hypothetical protein
MTRNARRRKRLHRTLRADLPKQRGFLPYEPVDNTFAESYARTQETLSDTLRYGKPPGGPALRGPRRSSVVFCARCGRPLLGPPGSMCPETCQLTPR